MADSAKKNVTISIKVVDDASNAATASKVEGRIQKTHEKNEAAASKAAKKAAAEYEKSSAAQSKAAESAAARMDKIRERLSSSSISQHKREVAEAEKAANDKIAADNRVFTNRAKLLAQMGRAAEKAGRDQERAHKQAERAADSYERKILSTSLKQERAAMGMIRSSAHMGHAVTEVAEGLALIGITSEENTARFIRMAGAVHGVSEIFKGVIGAMTSLVHLSSQYERGLAAAAQQAKALAGLQAAEGVLSGMGGAASGGALSKAAGAAERGLTSEVTKDVVVAGSTVAAAKGAGMVKDAGLFGRAAAWGKGLFAGGKVAAGGAEAAAGASWLGKAAGWFKYSGTGLGEGATGVMGKVAAPMIGRAGTWGARIGTKALGPLGIAMGATDVIQWGRRAMGNRDAIDTTDALMYATGLDGEGGRQKHAEEMAKYAESDQKRRREESKSLSERTVAGAKLEDDVFNSHRRVAILKGRGDEFDKGDLADRGKEVSKAEEHIKEAQGKGEIPNYSELMVGLERFKSAQEHVLENDHRRVEALEQQKERQEQLVSQAKEQLSLAQKQVAAEAKKYLAATAKYVRQSAPMRAALTDVRKKLQKGGKLDEKDASILEQSGLGGGFQDAADKFRATSASKDDEETQNFFGAADDFRASRGNRDKATGALAKAEGEGAAVAEKLIRARKEETKAAEALEVVIGRIAREQAEMQGLNTSLDQAPAAAPAEGAAPAQAGAAISGASPAPAGNPNAVNSNQAGGDTVTAIEGGADDMIAAQDRIHQALVEAFTEINKKQAETEKAIRRSANKAAMHNTGAV